MVVCTKASKEAGEKQFHVDKVLASLDGSLRRLGVDYVDVFQLHAVHPTQYDQVRDVIVPALRRAQATGKFRFLGITETSPNDPEHRMLHRALQDGIWDTAMFAFHLMHQPARSQVFPLTMAQPGRHADDVRGAADFCPPGTACGDGAATCGGWRGPRLAGGDR